MLNCTDFVHMPLHTLILLNMTQLLIPNLYMFEKVKDVAVDGNKHKYICRYSVEYSAHSLQLSTRNLDM